MRAWKICSAGATWEPAWMPSPAHRATSAMRRSAPTGVAINTEDRWDPAAAVVGGVWDQYIASGDDLWAALASSDYHGSGGDAIPCTFSRIHISRRHRAAMTGSRGAGRWHLLVRSRTHSRPAVAGGGAGRPAAALYPGESADVFTENRVAMARVDFSRGPGSIGAPSPSRSSPAASMAAARWSPGASSGRGIPRRGADSRAGHTRRRTTAASCARGCAWTTSGWSRT